MILAAAAAAALLAGGVAQALPLHPIGGGHPGGFHPGGPHPGGLHPNGFHPGHGFGGPHGGFYPVGFHHWGYGSYLPRGWLIPERFVVDFADYNLVAPPADYQWVQNGPDALLVNLDTGQVVQVVPGAFA
jgi:hypothetical protein